MTAPDDTAMLEWTGQGLDHNLYSVTRRTGQIETMTGYCLRHCFLNSIDDTVKSYELKEAVK
jgi:hypothetical protein